MMSTQQENALQKDPLGEHPNNLMHEVPRKRKRPDPEEKERLRQDKLLKRQQLENGREQKRKDREEAERKKQEKRHQRIQDEAEREQKRKQDEAEREQKRKEREEGERKKQEKKLQEETEKEQKREAERKKQLALKKQASFMDRFLVRKDQAGCGQSQSPESKTPSPEKELEKRESALKSEQASEAAAVVARMDLELAVSADTSLEEIWRIHLNSWLEVRSQYSRRKCSRWGVRRKPKVSVYRELRLQPSARDHYESHTKKTGDSSSVSYPNTSREDFDCCEDMYWKENLLECYPNSPGDDVKKTSSVRFHQLRSKRRKLLQFDKSHRPPYYGTFSKKSDYIRARHPLKQDPVLEYEVDSDEEWEEEDPGESLSDVEKDEEDEKVEIEDIEEDEDGADEFVVPDGYLSENEGVAVEEADHDVPAEIKSSQSPSAPVHHNVMSIGRLRRVLDNATDQALRSNHPLVISNLGLPPTCEGEMQSSQFPSNRSETLFLEALRISVLAPNVAIGVC